MKIIDKIKQHPLLKKLYSSLTYTEQGHGTASRFYSTPAVMLGYISSIVIVTHYQFTILEVIIYIIDSLLFFAIIGYFYNKSGFLKVDQEAQTCRNPIMNEIYQAALIIRRNENEKRKKIV